MTTTPLTAEEKREIAGAFQRLRNAIRAGDSMAAARFVEFRQRYRGDSLAIVQAFESATDKNRWVDQLGRSLRDEVESEYWDGDAAEGA